MQDVQGASTSSGHIPALRYTPAPPSGTLAPCAGGRSLQCVQPLCDGSVHRTLCSAPSHTLLPPHTSAPRLLEREVSASAAPTRPAGAGQQLLLAVRLQGCLRWRPEHRVRYDLRQPRGCQEVRAQVPPDAGAPRRHRSYRGAKRIEAPRWRERRALLLRRGTRSRRAAASPRAASVAQFGMGKAKTTARKQRKERKNRAKKARPTSPPLPPPPLATLATLCSHNRHTPPWRFPHRAPSILTGAWSQEGQDAGRCVGSCWWIAHGDGTSTKISSVYTHTLFTPPRIVAVVVCGYNSESKTKKADERGRGHHHQRRDGRRHAGFYPASNGPH